MIKTECVAERDGGMYDARGTTIPIDEYAQGFAITCGTSANMCSVRTPCLGLIRLACARPRGTVFAGMWSCASPGMDIIVSSSFSFDRSCHHRTPLVKVLDVMR